jgi:hypothetical protein
MSALVDLIPAKRSFVTALRVLRRAGLVSLRVSVHDLDRHVPVACVNKQPAAVRPVHVPVRAFLFEPGQSPSPDQAIPDALINLALLGGGPAAKP